MLFDYNQIIPGRLWVGSSVRPEDAKQLRRMGITIVVSLQSSDDLKAARISLKKLVHALSEANIDLRRVPVGDFSKEDLIRRLPRCVAEIEAALAPGWAKAYVHCTAGINRSPTAAAAYLIKSRGMSAGEAWEYVTSKRDCSPYLDVLEKYQASLSNDG
jgi:protein-tyrosine phosphatase